MKTVEVGDSDLETCVGDARSERVMVTRGGKPIALVVGIEGLDEEQIRLGSDPEFWRLIESRRAGKTISRAELERRLDDAERSESARP
jgi:hypothetical protein